MLAALAAVGLFAAAAGPALGLHAPRHPPADQGLNVSEERAFAKSLRLLLKNEDVDMVVTVRRSSSPADGCDRTGLVYWVYAERGTICFTRRPAGRAWDYDVDLIEGRNPVAGRSPTALATLAKERRASSTTLTDTDPRNLVDAEAVTYPYAYERIVAEFDSPRTGDFAIVPVNTADRGGKGAHGNLSVVQSRSTLLVAGRGSRRSPLSRREEKALHIKHVDIAPTVASVLGVGSYYDDTHEPARLLNGSASRTALMQRQDGRSLDGLVEPVFNTFVVVVDGLRPQDVNPTLMPNLTALREQDCEPGGACTTVYKQARAAMVTETNANHVAMVTGAYGERSGVGANETLDRDTGEAVAFNDPELNFAETLFDAIERQKPWLRTAGVFGKEKLRSLFDCTRRASGRCGPSSNNPEGIGVNHVRPDFLAGATTSPSDEDMDCPAEPASGSGYATNECTMDLALGLLQTKDPDFNFINLPETDAMSHVFGAGSPPALAAVKSADEQIGKLVDELKRSGKWQHSTVIVTADHNFGDTVNPENTIFFDEMFAGMDASRFEVVNHGGSASVFLTDLDDLNGPLRRGQRRTLKELRRRAVATKGVTGAFYRLPTTIPGTDVLDANTLEHSHPRWHLDGTPRIGELFITAGDRHAFSEEPFDEGTVILGEHGHATDRHVPFYVMSGGTYVADRTVRPSGAVDETDDTGALPEQAESVDIASTIAWILRVREPAQSSGRVLEEAFVKHPKRAQAMGDITEPIANRGAIFIFDANNSVEVHCLLQPRTCGGPVPEEARDREFIPTLRSLANGGTLMRFGSMAAWPSVTFPNHNVVGSGAYPGHLGVVNNRFYIRKTKEKEQPIDPTNTKNPVFQGTSRLLVDDVETLHEAVHRSFGDWQPGDSQSPDGRESDNAYTAAVNEPSARGADYATLEAAQSFPNPAEYTATQNPADLAADTTESCARENESYFEESTLDHLGQTQAQRVYDDRVQHPLPKYLINNFTLTDGAGHKFGPHTPCTLAAYHDSDNRLTRILQAMERAGVLGETMIVVTGDHGMENQNLERRGLPSDFERYLNDHRVRHVMTDWQVYLLTLDIGASRTDFEKGRRTTVTFTIRDDDTGDPVGNSKVAVRNIEEGRVTGTTGDEGTVTLTFTPKRRVLRVKARHDDFNRRIRFFPVVVAGPDASNDPPEDNGAGSTTTPGEPDSTASGSASSGTQSVLGSTDSSGTGSVLPFTGAPLAVLILVASSLIGTGVALARRGAVGTAR